MAETRLELNIEGKKVTEPKEWDSIKFHAAFGTTSNQPQIESDRFTLVKDAANSVIKNVAKGNIFEGQDCTLQYYERDLRQMLLNGFIDTSDDYEEINPSFGATERPNQVKVKFKGSNTITNFREQISGVTYGFLYNQGGITDSDFSTINTVIVKKSNFLEIALALITLYILEQQIEDTIKELSEEIPDLIQRLTSSPPYSIPSAGILAVVKAVIKIAYAVALVAVVIKMSIELIQLLIPPTVKNKGCKLRTLLSKACEFYGYDFVSPIEELDIYNYLPSKPFSDSKNIVKNLIPQNVPTKIGIPKDTDYGYLITDMFSLCLNMFDAYLDVVGNTVQLRNKQDPYWLKTSTFKPSININFPSKKYNTSELKQTRIDSFVIDPSDPWTLENYTGTSYEIKTSVKNPTKAKNIVIKGLDRTDYPVALPNSKTKLSLIETKMLLIAHAVDTLSSLIGKKSNMVSNIKQNRINVLKVGSNDYTVAKLVPLVGGQLPPNHRDLLSAKVLNQKYHQGKSFVTGEKLGQKILYDKLDLPFALDDFQKTIKNGTFILNDGRKSRFRDATWQISKDRAEVNLEVHHVYTNNLKETYIEP